jgi:hypothetical protein
MNRFFNTLISQIGILNVVYFFRNDKNDIISNRGWEVLNNPEMMEKVNRKIRECKISGGDVVVDFSE